MPLFRWIDRVQGAVGALLPGELDYMSKGHAMPGRPIGHVVGAAGVPSRLAATPLTAKPCRTIASLRHYQVPLIQPSARYSCRHFSAHSVTVSPSGKVKV